MSRLRRIGFWNWQSTRMITETHHILVSGIAIGSLAISAQAGNIYSGLWYAIVVAVMTVIIGTIFVPNGTHKKDIFADDNR